MWTDYHFLNSTFRRVALSTPEVWIDPDVVRVSYRGVKREAKFESVRQLEGLSVEYQAGLTSPHVLAGLTPIRQGPFPPYIYARPIRE